MPTLHSVICYRFVDTETFKAGRTDDGYRLEALDPTDYPPVVIDRIRQHLDGVLESCRAIVEQHRNAQCHLVPDWHDNEYVESCMCFKRLTRAVQATRTDERTIAVKVWLVEPKAN